MGTDMFGPPPAPTLEVTPTAEEVDFFGENGYLVVDRITTDEELAWLTEIYEHIFAPENAGCRAHPSTGRTGTARTEPVNLSQAFMPEINHPELLQTTYVRNARRYAAALLDVDIALVSCWGHMIRKLPGGLDAPWHSGRGVLGPGAVLPRPRLLAAAPRRHRRDGRDAVHPWLAQEPLRTHTHHDDNAAVHILVADDVDTSTEACARCRPAVHLPLPAHPALHRAEHHRPAAAGVPDRVPARTDVRDACRPDRGSTRTAPPPDAPRPTATSPTGPSSSSEPTS